MGGGNRGHRPQIFPIAFSDVACGVQGHDAPRVYRHHTRGIVNRAKVENDGEEIIKIVSFQLYNGVKQQIRRNARNFYPCQSIMTAATNPSARQGSAKDRRTQRKYKDLMGTGQPFSQIVAGAMHAITVGRARTRMEPVLTIEFGSIVQPRPDGVGVWRYVVNELIWPMFCAVSENVEAMCVEMIDMYHPAVDAILSGAYE